MKTIKTFVESHPLLSYLALTFAISWGGIILAVRFGPGGFSATPEQFRMTAPYAAIPAMLLGPSVAGIVLTGLVNGRAGFRELRSRLLKWRVGARWYAVALLTTPLSVTATLLALSLISPEYLPGIFTSDEKVPIVLMGIAVGLIVGIFEELGWTGFAIPTLRRQRYGVVSTGLLVGVLWGAWHFLQSYWASGVTSGELSLALWLSTWLISTLVGSLVAYRVLMVWVYEHTNGSLLVAMLMHASLSASQIILIPLVWSGEASIMIGFAYAAALWIVVAVVALANHGHLSRQPLLPRRRMA
jgi:membrane protease YdiL (CAAX protease family)